MIHDISNIELLTPISQEQVKSLKRHLIGKDEWLSELMDEYLETNDPFDTAIAAGLFARLREDSPETASECVKYMLTGMADPQQNEYALWAKSLNYYQINTLVRLFDAQIDICHEELFSLGYGNLTTEQRQECYLDLIRKRDDLECVFHVLSYHPESIERIEHRLDDFYSILQEIFVELPPPSNHKDENGTYIPYMDERLHRIRSHSLNILWTTDI